MSSVEQGEDVVSFADMNKQVALGEGTSPVIYDSIYYDGDKAVGRYTLGYHGNIEDIAVFDLASYGQLKDEELGKMVNAVKEKTANVGAKKYAFLYNLQSGVSFLESMNLAKGIFREDTPIGRLVSGLTAVVLVEKFDKSTAGPLKRLSVNAVKAITSTKGLFFNAGQTRAGALEILEGHFLNKRLGEESSTPEQ